MCDKVTSYLQYGVPIAGCEWIAWRLKHANAYMHRTTQWMRMNNECKETIPCGSNCITWHTKTKTIRQWTMSKWNEKSKELWRHWLCSGLSVSYQAVNSVSDVCFPYTVSQRMRASCHKNVYVCTCTHSSNQSITRYRHGVFITHMNPTWQCHNPLFFSVELAMFQL